MMEWDGYYSFDKIRLPPFPKAKNFEKGDYVDYKDVTSDGEYFYGWYIRCPILKAIDKKSYRIQVFRSTEDADISSIRQTTKQPSLNDDWFLKEDLPDGFEKKLNREKLNDFKRKIQAAQFKFNEKYVKIYSFSPNTKLKYEEFKKEFFADVLNN